jgi:hypothetical protein
MSTQPRDDDTIITSYPPVPPSGQPAGAPLAGLSQAAIQEAGYAIAYECDRSTLSAEGAEAYDRLRAADYPRSQAVPGQPVTVPQDEPRTPGTGPAREPQRQTLIPEPLVKWSTGPRYLAYWAAGAGTLLIGIIMLASSGHDNATCSALIGQYVSSDVYSHCRTASAVHAWGGKLLVFGIGVIVVAAIIGAIRLAENNGGSKAA